MRTELDVRVVDGEVLLWLFRTVGALAGSAISLAYFLPSRKRDAFMRLVVGFTSGLVFGRPVGLHLSRLLDLRDDLPRLEINLLGAAVASLTAWWVLGLVKRFIRSKGGDLYGERDDAANR